jgi:MFS family permease
MPRVPQAHRRPRPGRRGRSLAGVVLALVGAVLGALSSLLALLAGSYALAYAEGELRFGGYDYGCHDQACATGHTQVAPLCFAAVMAYVLLVALSLSTSVRALRAGMRAGLVASAVILGGTVVLSPGDDWYWLAMLALSPMLMALGSWRRLQAKESWGAN